MWSLKEYMLLFFMRFIALSLTYLVGTSSALYAKSIIGHSALRDPPYPPQLVIATVLGAIFGCIGGSWCLVFIFDHLMKGCSPDRTSHLRYLFICALMDLMLTAGFVVAAIVQAKTLPRPLGKCVNLERLKPVGGDGKSYFDLLGELPLGPEGRKLGPGGMCGEFVLVWRTEIAMAVVSGFACLMVSCSIYKAYRVPFMRYLLCPLNLGICYLRYWNRASQRRTARRHARHELEVQKAQMELEKKRQARAAAAADVEVGLQKHGAGLVKISRAEVHLSKMLGSYGISTALVGACHHADFRSLMRVSKTVRAAALGAMGAEMVQKLTCSSESKGQCWSCGEQICTDCTVSRTLCRDNEVSFHLNCKPHCSSCYRRKFCRHRPQGPNCNVRQDRWWVFTPSLCSCSAQPGVQDTYEMSLCMLCKLENDEMALLEQRQARGLAGAAGPEEAANVVVGGRWRCSECGTCMKRHNVWWICALCGRECGTEFHDKGCR
ncbi:hypothetical protein BDZ91DRAFT_786026 [Kalaharituber pfeilii]|nr:hypothetical protein BDZ91DRAFT_786026 [Kalaharituber pfeilii]